MQGWTRPAAAAAPWERVFSFTHSGSSPFSWYFHSFIDLLCEAHPGPCIFTALLFPSCLTLRRCLSLSGLTFLFSFSFLATSRHVEFLAQGSGQSCSCNLSHSCSNAGSLIHSAGPGIKHVSQRSQDAADPIVLQWEFLASVFLSPMFM